MRKSLLTLTVVAGLLPSLALAWWNDDWNFRKAIVVNTGATGPAIAASVDNVPVLIRLHIGNFGYFGDTKPDGSDIRFVAGDDKTPLPFHIESYDPAGSMAFIWVRIPRLTPGGSEKIFMYYGDASAPAGADAAGTYDVNQVLVYHFSGERVADVTSYANNPAQSAAMANPGSVIGEGVRFNGTRRIAIAASPSLRLIPSQGMTVSAWVNVDQEQADSVIFEGRDPSGASFTLAMDALTPYLRVTGAGGTVDTPRGTPVTAGSWHLLTAVIAADKIALYVDGQSVGEAPAAVAEIGGEFSAGGSVEGSRFLVAQLDELTVAKTARSADWVKAQFANQGQQDTLLTYGEDASREAGKEPSYFLITLQNVTVDGWAVIGLLVIMAVLSWVIMITKGLTINRIRKDNAAFLTDFRKTDAGSVTALDRAEDDAESAESPFIAAMAGEHDHYQSSSLYHLYHMGMKEVRKRVEGVAVGADRNRVITRQAMDAIRATLDAANVRETQKLNNQMVLLTLAIAGGPFLGLLGTVVGVMITFAAIAASGDVNVNAIAPGIAAALVATVAGLSVAIPALFGYNFLASRIKEIVADDRVFIDEFTTRLAEHYS